MLRFCGIEIACASFISRTLEYQNIETLLLFGSYACDSEFKPMPIVVKLTQ